MAEVKLYIYKGDQKGEPVTQRGTGSFFFDKSTVLPPVKDDVTGTLKTTTITNTYHISLPSLAKLTYHKKVYEPCEIFAYIQLGSVQKRTIKTTKTTRYDKDGKEIGSEEKKEVGEFDEFDNEMTNRFRGTASSVNSIINNFLGAKVILEIDGNTVAENYLVFKVRTTYKTISNSTSRFLELTIYSADKMMDLDKYSRAYTARRLYTDILAEESKKFNLKDAEKDEECTSLSKLIANHMQLLKYKETKTEDSKTYEWADRDELRIPYIVQYNESFYRFMVRNANRFGEFLYFEDGKLNLGMQPSEANYFKLDSNGEREQKNGEDVVIDWATEPNAVQSRFYESMVSEGVTVKDRAYDFTSHKPDSESAFVDSADSRYNFDPVSTDEWTNQDIKKNEYHEFKEILGEEMKAYVAEFVFKALEMKSVGEALVVLVKETLGKIYEVWNSVADYNNQLDKANYQDKDDKDLVFDDQRYGKKYSQFTTYNGSTHLQDNLKVFSNDVISNFTSYFYSTIRKKEKEIGEQAVWLDFGSFFKPIKLGDKLHVDGQDYVAISVEGSYENGQEHLIVSALPVMTLTDTSTTTGALTAQGEDAWTTTLPFPPALPDVVIRDARPQVAFVAATLDPQNMGRIRVRYPWQDKDGDASPWIRITLPLATAGGAVNFTPSEGDEVMVGYEHGNIDRPYAMGYLVAPFVNEHWSNALPMDQYGTSHGIRTKTGHHLTFEDGFAFAPMLFNTLGATSCIKSLWPVGATGPWPFGNELTADFGGGFELSDRYGFYKITGSTDERSVSIASPAGTVEVNAFQGISINAPNGDIEIKGKNVSISASNQLSLTSGENIKDKLWYQKKWENGAKGKLASLGALALAGGKDALSTLGEETIANLTDVSFIRCLMEWLIRPINGTLQIKSYTFVTIEAGEGKAELPPESLRKYSPSSLYKIYVTSLLIGRNVYALIGDIHKKYDALCDATIAFNAISGNSGINKDESAISFEKVIEKGKTELKMDSDFSWEDGNTNNLKLEEVNFTEEEPKRESFDTNEDFLSADLAWYYRKREYLEGLTLRNLDRQNKRTVIVKTSNQLRQAANDLSDAAKKWTDMEKEDFKSKYTSNEADISDAVKKIKAEKLITDLGIMSLDEMKNCSYGKDIEKIDDAVWKLQQKYLTRYIIFKYLSGKSDIKQDKGQIHSIDDVFYNNKWRAYVKSLEKNESILHELSGETKDWFKENMIPFRGFKDDQKKWKNGFKGKILLSEQEGRTASFDNNFNMKTHVNQDFDEQSIEELHKLLNKA